jgi:hypothetical protein
MRASLPWLSLTCAAALVAGSAGPAAAQSAQPAKPAAPAAKPAAPPGGPAHKGPKTDKEKIANAMTAAPRAVASKATIMDMDDKGQMRTLRPGTSGFTCLPDNPMTPGNDPMCLDKNGMEWAGAWMSKQPPPQGKIGFGYMLAGGSDASNTDPHAVKPAPGGKWVDTGPHVMILNYGTGMEGYPRQGENPDTTQPYVMWPGTPWEHLMIPVR